MTTRLRPSTGFISPRCSESMMHFHGIPETRSTGCVPEAKGSCSLGRCREGQGRLLSGFGESRMEQPLESLFGMLRYSLQSEEGWMGWDEEILAMKKYGRMCV